MASPDGHTRTFDAQAGGTVFSDGVAVVVLRRLSDAIADGDPIYAVMLGAAVNNDGSERASFTAPSPEGQAAVIAAAHDAAGIDARTLSYVEAHGTATPLGDPIEIEGLTRAFGRHTQERGFCAIGSLEEQRRPHGDRGRRVEPDQDGARAAPAHAAAVDQLRGADAEDRLRAHAVPRADRARAVAARAPARAAPGSARSGSAARTRTSCSRRRRRRCRSTPSPRAAEVLLVSARSAPALAEACANLARYLAKAPDEPALLADVAHTLQIGRRGFAHRRYVVAASAAEAAPPARDAGAEQGRHARARRGAAASSASCSPARARSTRAWATASTRASRRSARRTTSAARSSRRITGADPRALFFAEDPQALVPTSVTQPAIFTLEYALARLWMSWGVDADRADRPQRRRVRVRRARRRDVARGRARARRRARAAHAGAARRQHAVGAAARRGARAAAAAGRGDRRRERARRCAWRRARPRTSRALEAELAAAGVAARRLVTSHAFHSAMMDPVIEPLAARIAAVRLSPPKIPILSTVTARLAHRRRGDEHALLGRAPAPAGAVRAGGGALLAEPRRVLIEIGPRATLSALARQAVTGKRALPPAIPSLADAPEREAEAVAAALGQLWTLGATIDWAGYRRHRAPPPRRRSRRTRSSASAHWVDAPAATASASAVAPPARPPSPPRRRRRPARRARSHSGDPRRHAARRPAPPPPLPPPPSIDARGCSPRSASSSRRSPASTSPTPIRRRRGSSSASTR